jgi:hypothetical protein
MHCDPIFPRARQLNRGEVGDAIWCDVVFGIPHFIHQLLGDALHRDASPGALVFGHDETSVGFGLDDGIAGILETGDPLPTVEAVSARALGAALDDVAGDSARCQPIPIIHGPSEFVDHGTEGQPRIGDAARDDDIGSLFQGLDDGLGAKVDVGTLDLIANRSERLTGIHVFELRALGEHGIEAIHDVVASNDPDAYLASESQFPCGFDDCVGTRFRVDTSGIGGDANPAFHQFRE